MTDKVIDSLAHR